ncbi:hypothetical protein [Sporolactobacillus putidus]|uniref:Uncharacterized protein n=1 Tax=Sporolactobacillus putidus TaxID=492735 RepID=A0A917RZA4_9BACL|nr:hypothetical protein [Sporolactobacillus putidus]GGL44186.1 hypothetical protein GCM10007968_05260 [Sporolactobacillus putidus]
MNLQPYAVNQSQMIGTFEPDQILRGRVLEILPDRTALVQLGAERMVARVGVIVPPLKIGQDYLFQIRQNTNPLLAKVIDRRSPGTDQPAGSVVDDVRTAFNLKNDSVTRQIIQAFLDHGDSLSRHSVLAARALLGGGAGALKDIPVIRWMLNRGLPMTPAFFQTAKNQINAPTLSTQLTDLKNALNQLTHQTPPTQSLKAALDKLAAIKGTPPLSLAAGLVGQSKAAALLKSFLKEQDPGLQLSDVKQAAFVKFLRSPMTVPDTAVMLNKIGSSLQPEAFIGSFRGYIAAHSGETVLQNVLNGTGSPGLLFNVLKQVGFDYEHSLGILLENGNPAETGSIKEKLLTVMQDVKTPNEIRKMSAQAVQRITGEQIQMASSDPLVAQFLLQLPVPFQKEIRNATVYWEGKKNGQGTIDPDYCTILFSLDLKYLKKTLVGMRVQNRSVTLTVQNDFSDLGPLLKKGRPILAEQLEALNYHLVSFVQTKKLDDRLIAKLARPLAVSNYTLDVKI